MGDFLYFQAYTLATGNELYRAGPGGIDLVSDLNPESTVPTLQVWK